MLCLNAGRLHGCPQYAKKVWRRDNDQPLEFIAVPALLQALRDFLRKSDADMGFWVVFLVGHRMPALTMAVKTATTAIGKDIADFLACSFVLQGQEFLQGAMFLLSGVEYRLVFVRNDTQYKFGPDEMLDLSIGLYRNN